MQMKRVVEKCTLSSAAAEFYAFKRAQKIRERTLYDYRKYIDPFVKQSSNSMDITVLKREIMSLQNSDYNPDLQSITVSPEVSKICKSRTFYLSPTTNTALKKFLKVKPKEWENRLFLHEMI